MANFKAVEQINKTVNINNKKLLDEAAKAADEAGKFSFEAPQGVIVDTEGQMFKVKLDNGKTRWFPFYEVEIIRYEDEDGDEW